jgi:hypothetical protein
MIAMDRKIENFIQALESAGYSPKQRGNEWLCRCPAHNDKSPSLSVGEGKDGRVLIRCHAGCEAKAIVQAVGMRLTDIMPPSDKPQKAASNRLGQLVATYDYRDAYGSLLFQALRYEPKTFRQRKPKPSGGWDYSVEGVKKVPFKLPEILGRPGEPVYVVEGEKDVLSLERCGILATCNAAGAGKWTGEHAAHLAGRDVVILPDNDEIGRKHGRSVALSLAGLAKSIKVVELPGLADKGDVSDWLSAGGTVAQLQEIVTSAPEWTAEGQEAAASVTKPISDYIKTLRTNLQSRELRTLYNCGTAFAGFEIGAGLLTALGAPPGRGKTALAMQLVFAAVENEPRLHRVVIAGNDTSPETLLTREIVRLTRLRSDDVRFNTLTDIDRERALDGLADIEARCGMVEILNPPDFLSLAALLDTPPGLLLVDYLQLFAPAGDDIRKGVNDTMSLLRALAMNGWAVLALSAVKRPANGVYNDKALDLSSFRESSEIEFQIDAGYVLKDIQPIEENRPWVRLVTLECVKNRHGATQSRDLVFDKSAMSFSLYNDGLDADVDALCGNPFAEVSQ